MIRPPRPTAASRRFAPDEGGIDAASEAAATLPTFLDDFARPNGQIGNGWIEKTSGAFALTGGAVQQSQGGIYRNLFNSRPASEDAPRRPRAGDGHLPRQRRRPRPASLGSSRAPTWSITSSAYSVYPDGANNLYVSRDDGSMFIDQGSSVDLTAPRRRSVVSPLPSGDGHEPRAPGGLARAARRHRARDHHRERRDPRKRLATPGSVGFGSSASVDGRWDDFNRITLP